MCTSYNRQQKHECEERCEATETTVRQRDCNARVCEDHGRMDAEKATKIGATEFDESAEQYMYPCNLNVNAAR